MICIIVGKPHPPQVLRINDRLKSLHELLTLNSHSRVHEDRLSSLDHEGIDREESHAGNREMGGKDLDIWQHFMEIIHRKLLLSRFSAQTTSTPPEDLKSKNHTESLVFSRQVSLSEERTKRANPNRIFSPLSRYLPPLSEDPPSSLLAETAQSHSQQETKV